MKFSEIDTTKLSENVTEATLKQCKRILSRYDDLDSESKILARQSFINAILNDPNIEKKMSEVAEKHFENVYSNLADITDIKKI